ncbi:unnamed protein product [Polarella glacialis]|uniref:Uncharacterized protein n=1 Tax=Polarella glacialis TaxID=89957 RepID=A0A813GAF9_POLGL|nr:unnamed protein product [Polarella glacialis]
MRLLQVAVTAAGHHWSAEVPDMPSAGGAVLQRVRGSALKWRAGASDQIVISGDMPMARSLMVSVTSPFNPPVGPRDTMGGSDTSEMWSGIGIMVPGTYQVCWCGDGLGDCDSNEDFIVWAGTIVVSGPTPGVVQEHKCIAGVTCTVQMTGSGLSDFDRIRIISGWQECGYASMTSDVLQGAAGKRSSGDASISRYGGVILGRQGLFKVCWCGSKTASCATEDFNMYVGNLTVGGPQQGRVDNPPIGMPFSYAVEGWGLSDTDRIRIVNADVRCASSDAATMSPGVEAESALFGPPTTVSGPEPTNRTSVRWSNILITQMAEYRVCWCARFTGGCQTGANFALDIGMISPRGAANTTKIAAIPGRPFALVVKAMPGSTLSITDRMRIVDRQLSRGECGVSGTSTHAPAVSALVCWPTCVNSSRNSAPRLGPGNASETWDPILIMDNGLFDICWCSSGLGGCDSDADFSYKVGEIVSAGVSVGHKWSCAAYLPCFLEVPITGGVTVDDMVQLVPAGNSVKCGSTQQSDGSSFTRGTRVTGFKSVNSAGASVMVFEFGNPQGTGIFQACYCQGPVCRQPQVSDMDFFQRAGEVTVSGIQDNDAYHKCYLRGDCPLVIKGTGLRAQDAVMLYDIQDSCGQSGDPVDFSSDGPTFYTSAGDRMFIGALAGVTNDGVESWKFDLGSPNLVGRKRLCYCSQSRAGGGMCRYRADFDQPAGEIYVRGSEFNAEVRCNQGEPCRITVRGHAFDRSDRILLLKDGPNRTCGMANPDYWGVNPDIIIPDLWAATYNLISVREPGSYLVCYCAYIFGSETCVAPTAALPPYQRYPHQIGSLRVTGSILALRKVGSTPQSALPAAPFAASVEVDAMNSGLKFTCVATSRAAPDGFIPMKSDLLNCSMDVMVLSERQKLMPRCWGISTTPSAVPAIGPNLVHVPLFMSADALKTTVNLHVWCFGSAMCSNDRCVMPADSEGLSLPLTSGLQTTTAVWSATVGTPFGLRVQLGSDFDLGAEWPRVKIISSGEACDRTLLHSSVSGLACVASGVGKCEPGPSASLSTVSWGAGREIVWDNVKVSKADAYDVCYCDRHYDLTCVAWQRIGILVVKGPLNAGSYQYWGNPGEQFQISLQGSGLAVADRLRVVKQAARCTDQFDGYSANNLAPTTVPPTPATTTSTAPNSSNGTGSRRLQLNTDWRSGSAAFANGSVANFYGQIDGIGDYRVCWCGGAGRSCQQPAEFTVDLGTLKVAVKKACVVTAWWVVKQCNVECGGGQVSSRRGITSQAEGGGTPCPSEQELYKLEQCNMEPCPLARVDVAFTEPAKVFAGGAGFQINVEGDWLDPAADRVVLIAEGDRCGKTEVHFGGASCAQDGATGRRLVCGDGITSIRVAKAGRYRLCVCDASGAFVRSADGTQNISTGSFEAAGITGMGCATPNLYTLEPSAGSVLVIEEYVPASATSTKDEALSAAAIAGVTGAVGLILLTAGMGTCWWVRKRSKAHAQKVMDEAAAEQQAAAQKAQGAGGMDPQMLQWYESYYQSLGYPPGTATQADEWLGVKSVWHSKSVTSSGDAFPNYIAVKGSHSAAIIVNMRNEWATATVVVQKELMIVDMSAHA